MIHVLIAILIVPSAMLYACNTAVTPPNQNTPPNDQLQGESGGTGLSPTGGDLVVGTGGAGGTGGVDTTGGTELAGTGGTDRMRVTGGVSDTGGIVSTANTGGVSATGGEASTGGESPSVSFPPVSDFMAPGPFTATTTVATGPDGNYTLYHPADLGAEDRRHPIVGWMSGGGTEHSGYALLPHLASHGFFVVAANVVPGIGQEAQLGAQILAGIDWAIAENDNMNSPLYQRLATHRVASAGYSMGSLATFTIADDPRLTTTVHVSGGNMAPERVSNLHAPAAFICGTPGDTSCNILSGDCDIAAVNCDADFQNATSPVFYANFTGGHLGILLPPHGERINAMTTAWLRYKLMDDASVESRFVGPTCEYCTDSNWKVQQKLLP